MPIPIRHPVRTGQASEPPLNLVLLIGSARSPRVAAPLAAWLRGILAAHPDFELHVVDVADFGSEPQGLTPGGAASSVSARLAEADAFLVLTPEYNHSFPAPLKHLL